MIIGVAIVSTYLIKYDDVKQLDGLTAWSVAKAKELFKGSKINNAEGERIRLNWKLKEGEDNVVNFSENDMKRMAANDGDLVYICDARKYLGGLKSIHAVYGKPHNEDGIVYISNEDLQNGVFVKDRMVTAEKEM